MENKKLNPESLKALAHPLRAELFRALREEPATSAQLARRFGENTGTVSWHLRQLARFGFIADDPGHGDRRERWWRADPGRLTLDIRDYGIRDDAASMEAARWYVHDTWQRVYQRLAEWIESAQDWSTRWIGASVLHEEVLRLTPTQLASLQEELAAAVDRYRSRDDEATDPDACAVQVGYQAFPLGEPDGD